MTGRKVHYCVARGVPYSACGRKAGDGTYLSHRPRAVTCKSCLRYMNGPRCTAERAAVLAERAAAWAALSATHVEQIRARDGDDCWLCRRAIDFTLRGSDELWAVSIDHVVPRSMGGESTLENKKLAHRQCNSSRDDIWRHTLPGRTAERI